MPPSAAPEWLRVGWSLETIATSAPASWASMAARMPAQPAPITSTSCLASTSKEATESVAPRRIRTDGAGWPPPAPSLPLRRVGADCVRRHRGVVLRLVEDRGRPARPTCGRSRLDHEARDGRVGDGGAASDRQLPCRAIRSRRQSLATRHYDGGAYDDLVAVERTIFTVCARRAGLAHRALDTLRPSRT